MLEQKLMMRTPTFFFEQAECDPTALKAVVGKREIFTPPALATVVASEMSFACNCLVQTPSPDVIQFDIVVKTQAVDVTVR